MIKTLNLTANTETAVNGLGGNHARIVNGTTGIMYASANADVTAGADNVIAIQAGKGDYVVGANGTVYLLAVAGGTVQCEGCDYLNRPFDHAAEGGGGTVDDVARQAIDAHTANTAIHATADGKTISYNDGVLTANYIGENLLDNPDFSINQRGLTTYPGNSYNVDRWRNNTSTIVTSLTENGISIVVPIMSGWVHYETIEYNDVAERELTASCKVTNCGSNIKLIISYRSSNDTEILANSVYIVNGTNEVEETVPEGTKRIRVGFYTTSNPGTTVEVSWFKLEYGSIATPFVPPNPATELAKCQRYYYNPAYLATGGAYTGIRRTGGVNLVVPINLPAVMRIQPSASSTQIEVFDDTGAWVTLDAVTSYTMGVVHTLEYATGTATLTAHENYLVRGVPALSAEL